MQLKSNCILITQDSSDEKMGYKIRQSQIKKVPYTIVIGDNEVRDNTLSIRKHGEDEEHIFAATDFIELIKKEKHILY